MKWSNYAKKWMHMVEVIEEGVFNYKTIDELVVKSKGNYPGTDGPRITKIVIRMGKDYPLKLLMMTI